MTCAECPFTVSAATSSGPLEAKLAVVGEAPRPGETKPFTDEAGKWFRELMLEVGINPSKLLFTNVVSCTPLEGGLYRAPTAEEAKRCHHGRNERLANARFILLVGSVALKSYRPDLMISKARGHAFTMRAHDLHLEGPIMLPTIHPAGALRNPAWIPKIRSDLELLLELGRDPLNWDSRTPDVCVQCEEEGQNRDPYLLAYCDKHFAERKPVQDWPARW